MTKQVGKLSSVPFGSVARFAYYGGSLPGSIRTVVVTKHTDDGIIGIDLDTKMVRHFLDRRTDSYITLLNFPNTTHSEADRAKDEKLAQLFGLLADVYACIL